MIVMRRITFAAEPPVGLAVAVDGQRYDLAAIEPHQRLDGTPTRLLVWRTECANCGVGFTCRSTVATLPEVRRCEQHRRPGVKVRRVLDSRPDV